MARQSATVLHQLVVAVPYLDAIGVKKQLPIFIGNGAATFAGKQAAIVNGLGGTARKIDAGTVAKVPVVGLLLSKNGKGAEAEE